jgi:hypothetical protein
VKGFIASAQSRESSFPFEHCAAPPDTRIYTETA